MQRALTAARIAAAAILFPGAHDQSVKFIIQGSVARETGLEELLDLFVAVCGRSKLMTFEYPSRISVDDEDWMLARIEQDGIRCFGADAMNREQFFTQDC